MVDIIRLVLDTIKTVTVTKLRVSEAVCNIYQISSIFLSHHSVAFYSIDLKYFINNATSIPGIIAIDQARNIGWVSAKSFSVYYL